MAKNRTEQQEAQRSKEEEERRCEKQAAAAIVAIAEAKDQGVPDSAIIGQLEEEGFPRPLAQAMVATAGGSQDKAARPALGRRLVALGWQVVSVIVFVPSALAFGILLRWHIRSGRAPGESMPDTVVCVVALLLALLSLWTFFAQFRNYRD
jgi:hypothetical protein